ncbi:MAG: hypothetical protein AAF443_01040 [Chlamydiota bacterium]
MSSELLLNQSYRLQSSQSGGQGNIALVINDSIINSLNVQESKLHLVARRLFQSLSIVAGFSGRIPFIEMNLKLGGDNKPYGGALAYGTCASFGYLVSYSLLEIVNSQMTPLSKEEKALKESRIGPSIKKVIFISSMILGFSTQIPFAYIAYKYNSPSSLNPKGLLMPIMVISIDSWVSTYSGYMGLKTLREVKSLDAYEKQLARVRAKMASLIECNRQLLVSANHETQINFIDSYERIKEVDDISDRVKKLYVLFTNNASDQTLSPSRCAKYIDWTVKAYGYLCAISNIGTLGYIAWRGTNDLMSNNVANVTVTSLYVGTALYLNATAIPATAVKLFNLFKNFLMCNYKPTLSDKLTPKLSFSLKALGLVTASLSYGPAVEIVKGYYGDKEGLDLFMEVVLSCATIFLVSMAIFSITNQILEYKIERMGTEEEKKLIAVHKKMLKLASVLESSPLIEIALFLKILPENIFNELISQTAIAISNLDSYIESRSRRTSKDSMSLQDRE